MSPRYDIRIDLTLINDAVALTGISSTNTSIISTIVLTGKQGADGVPGPQGEPGATGATGATGPTGPTGPAGANGTNGTDGTDGVDGSKWYNAAGAPGTGTGVVGDYYLNDTNGDVYEKTGASTWTLIGNITGPAGSGTGDMLLGTAQTVTAAKTFNAGTLIDKGSQVYDIRAYGAVIDGSTDDTAAIQAAVDAADAAQDGFVFHPGGIAKITSALTLKNGVSIVGIGGNSNGGGSIIRQVTAGAHALYMATTTAPLGNLSIENLRIESTAVTGTAHGIYLKNNSSNSTHPPFVYMNFKNLFITGFTGYGFNAESLIVSGLERVVSQENGGGFYFNGDGYGTSTYSSVNTSVNLLNCYANGNTGNGYYVKRSTYMTFSACAADSNGNQYVIERANSLAFIGCGAEYGPSENPSTGNGWDIQDSSSGISLYNCTTLYNQNYSIALSGNSYGITAIGFLDNDQGANAVGAINVPANSSVTLINPVLTGAVSGSGKVNYLDDGGGNMTVPGNVFFGGTTYATGDVTLENKLKMAAYQGIYNGTAKVLELGSFGTPVNGFGMEMAATGNGPTLYVQGTDTNSDMSINAKGTGKVSINRLSTRLVKRETILTSSATPTFNTDNTDILTITALATNITSMTTNMTGTPNEGQELWVRIKGDATPRTITWGSGFQNSGVATLLATTAASKTHLSKFIYDSDAAIWVCVAVDATGY